jgi:F420-dependent oxidoreductase-like protein
MKMGIITPQGWLGEFAGWDPQLAWSRTVQVAQQAERLGFESVWLFDHFLTHPEPTDELTFESFTSLSALAVLTTRVRLGHLVLCTGYRNPALVAKMLSTMDTISGGRVELGIGAGWKRDEWEAYGYDFPETAERLGRLRDDLEVITRMLAGGKHDRATFDGTYSSVHGAINQPKPLRRMPIVVGGNGESVTWRLAATYADELNVDGFRPDRLATVLPIIRQCCEEVGRDPQTLAVSAHLWQEWLLVDRQERVDLFGGYRDLGISRVMGIVSTSAGSDDVLESLASDARDAGIELA